MLYFKYRVIGISLFISSLVLNIVFKNMKKFIAALVPSFVFLPLIASAQSTTIGSILSKIQGFLNFMIPALITVAVLYLIYGVITYVVGKDDGTKEKGRNVMISGIIGLFVIVAMWGLVAVLRNTFLDGQNGSLQQGQIPCVPGTGQIGC